VTPHGPVYAGIDLGTLTFRLLIARISADGALRELASERRIVRLGEGLQPSGRLQAAPMARALDAIQEWMPVIRASGATEIIAVATSAVRDAVNREVFLSEIKRRSGLEVEVLSGAEEARRALLGIASGLPGGPQAVPRFLAVDVGGGSTEFIKAQGEGSPKMISIDEGVVRLTEGCLRSDPVAPEEVASARRRIQRHLDGVEAQLGEVAGYQLIGTAGSITTLAAMDQRLATYASPRIHNYRLSRDRVRHILGELISRTSAERRQLTGLEPGREDVIIAGALILDEVMERFGFTDCLVSDYGLREGALIDRWQQSHR